MPKLIDGFMFFNELDLLEIRLNELSEIVDYFVLVESPVSHSGLGKPLSFQDNRERFRPFLPKIRHIIVRDMPAGDSWSREQHQRQCILRGLDDVAAGDWLLISDADEIPRASLIRSLVSQSMRFQETFYAFEQKLYYHFFNLYACLWQGTKAVRIVPEMDLWAIDLTQEVRYKPGYAPEVVLGKGGYGGWHFSSMGNPDTIRHKIENFAHTECVAAGLNDVKRISQCLDANRCLLNDQILTLEPRWDPSLPDYVQANQEKYRQYLK